jgi:hypothetical protein
MNEDEEADAEFDAALANSGKTMVALLTAGNEDADELFNLSYDLNYAESKLAIQDLTYMVLDLLEQRSCEHHTVSELIAELGLVAANDE